MQYRFSERVQGLKPSAIREIFKYSADPSYIPLSAGNPAPDAFPSEAISRISADLLATVPISALQYSITEGYAPLRAHLLDYMAEKHQAVRAHDAILVTSGAQQVMNLVTKALLDEGDTVLCEAPSFIGSLNTFRSYQAKLKGIAVEPDGVCIEQLEKALQADKRIKYFYTIPNFQNPSGVTMSLEKRKAVYALCKQHQVLILEDNPYGDLRFRGQELPSIKSMDEDGIVIYAGSFSKVIAPGFRVGYCIAPAEIIQKMVVCKQGEDVHTNIWAQIICHRFMTTYDFEAHLSSLRRIYKQRAEILEDAMARCFKPKGISWNPFDGGLFAWCTLPEGTDMMSYCEAALERKVCVVPGTAFLTDEATPCRSFRINFSTPTEKQLIDGVRILGDILP